MIKHIRIAALFILLALPAWADGYNNFDCWDFGFGPQNLSTGSHNTSCGQGNLPKLTTGSYNAAFGGKLAGSLTTGNSNVLLGYGCDVPSATTSNYLCIASSATTPAITGNMVAGGALWLSGESRVAADFQVSGSTALANITGLTATVEAGKHYHFNAELHFTADAAGGHKYAVASTGTATNILYQVDVRCNTTNDFVANQRRTALDSAVSQEGCTEGVALVSGEITPATAGNLTVQFAQSVAAGVSSVLRGSLFIVREVK